MYTASRANVNSLSRVATRLVVYKQVEDTNGFRGLHKLSLFPPTFQPLRFGSLLPTERGPHGVRVSGVVKHAHLPPVRPRHMSLSALKGVDLRKAGLIISSLGLGGWLVQDKGLQRRPQMVVFDNIFSSGGEYISGWSEFLPRAFETITCPRAVFGERAEKLSEATRSVLFFSAREEEARRRRRCRVCGASVYVRVCRPARPIKSFVTI